MPSHTTAIAAYARPHPGKYDRRPLLTARFYDAARDYSWLRAVPSATHVADNLTGPALHDVDTTDSGLRSAVGNVLAGVTRRYDDVCREYAGLWAALSLDLAPNQEADFDRDAYIDAIVAETARSLDRHRRTVTARAPRTRASVDPDAPAPLTAEERKARHKAEVANREREFARASIEALIDLEELEAGDTISRTDLVEALVNDVTRARRALERLREDNAAAQVEYTSARRDHADALEAWEQRKRMQPALSRATRPQRPPRPVSRRWEDVARGLDLPAFTPPSFGAKRAASLVIELASELGLLERRSASERFYVFQPDSIAQPTEETAMVTTHVDDILAEELLDRIARIAWEEKRAVLQAVLERRSGAPASSPSAPISDLGEYRARRAS